MCRSTMASFLAANFGGHLIFRKEYGLCDYPVYVRMIGFSEFY
jgi:hypothetical protein